MKIEEYHSDDSWSWVDWTILDEIIIGEEW